MFCFCHIFRKFKILCLCQIFGDMHIKYINTFRIIFKTIFQTVILLCCQQCEDVNGYFEAKYNRYTK